MRRIVFGALCGALGASLPLACSVDNETNGLPGGGYVAPAGCVQGQVVNGQNGVAIPPPKDEEFGVFFDAEGQPVRAQQAPADSGIVGRYSACGLPVGTDIPVYARFPGFEVFQGVVRIEPLVVDSSDGTLSLAARRSAIANIRLFPAQGRVNALRFSVATEGVAQPEALVTVTPLELPASEAGGLFLSPSLTSSAHDATTVVTGADVTAVMPTDALVLGGRYQLTVAPPAGRQSEAAQSQEFVYGVGSGVFDVSLPSAGTGCLQGVVIDGFDGEALTIAPDEAGDSASVIVTVHDTRIPAVPVGSHAPGAYHLCGLPLDETFPLEARVVGYQPFFARVSIPSRVPQRSPAADTDVEKPSATQVANIRLLPLGLGSEAFTMELSAGGEPLVGARVRLVPAGLSRASAYETIGRAVTMRSVEFLAPLASLYTPLEAMSDANGVVAWPADELVLGGVYAFMILPAAQDYAVGSAAGTLAVGFDIALDDNAVGGQAQMAERFVAQVDVAAAAPELRLLSSSLAVETVRRDGQVVLLFDRPVQLQPGTHDEVRAELVAAERGGQRHDHVEARLVADIANNQAIESADVEIVGRRVTLRPRFVEGREPNPVREAGLKVRYEGLAFVAKDGARSPLVLPNRHQPLEIALFGGKTLPKAIAPDTPGGRSEVRGGGQTGRAGETLGQTIVVHVADQWGRPFANQPVTVEVAAGEGFIQERRDGQPGEVTATDRQLTLSTDVDGNVYVMWRLGEAGAQSLRVELPAVWSGKHGLYSDVLRAIIQ